MAQMNLPYKRRVAPDISPEDLSRLEENFLSYKVQLADNTSSYVYSCGPKISTSNWSINCHVCLKLNISFSTGKCTVNFFGHNAGRKHSLAMKYAAESKTSGSYNQPIVSTFSKHEIKIFPGEVLNSYTKLEGNNRPPKQPQQHFKSIKKEIKQEPDTPTNSLITKYLHRDDFFMKYNKEMPVIGLSFIVKSKSKMLVIYHCMLCDPSIDLIECVDQHLFGAPHILKFMERQFPKLLERMHKILKEKGITDEAAAQKHLITVFRYLHLQIEDKFGRKDMFFARISDYDSNTEEISKEIFGKAHFSQSSTNFTVSDEELNSLFDDCINGKPPIADDNPESLINPGDATTSNIIQSEQRKIKRVQADLEALAKNTSNKNEIIPLRARISTLEEKNKEDKEKLVHATKLKEAKALSTASRRRHNARHTKANTRFEITGFELERFNIFGNGEGPPEKRARNSDEDKQDWDRYRVMLGEELDKLDNEYDEYFEIPENHPGYSKEWQKFWSRRVSELERAHVDVDNYDFVTEWIQFWKNRIREIYNTKVMSYKEECKRILRLSSVRTHSRSPSPIRTRRSRFSKEFKLPPAPTISIPRRNLENPIERGETKTRMESEEHVDSETLSLISVLRLLTALEDHLGSLGPKALEFLSEAVLCEKEGENPNSILLRNEVYIFLMTTGEKLKGQIAANIVEANRITVVKRAANQITQLIDEFELFLLRNNMQRPSHSFDAIAENAAKQSLIPKVNINQKQFGDDNPLGLRDPRHRNYTQSRDDSSEYSRIGNYRTYGGFEDSNSAIAKQDENFGERDPDLDENPFENIIEQRSYNQDQSIFNTQNSVASREGSRNFEKDSDFDRNETYQKSDVTNISAQAFGQKNSTYLGQPSVSDIKANERTSPVFADEKGLHNLEKSEKAGLTETYERFLNIIENSQFKTPRTSNETTDNSENECESFGNSSTERPSTSNQGYRNARMSDFNYEVNSNRDYESVAELSENQSLSQNNFGENKTGGFFMPSVDSSKLFNRRGDSHERNRPQRSPFPQSNAPKNTFGLVDKFWNRSGATGSALPFSGIDVSLKQVNAVSIFDRISQPPKRQDENLFGGNNRRN